MWELLRDRHPRPRLQHHQLSPGAAQLTYTFRSLECGDCCRITLLTVTTPRPHGTAPAPALSIVNPRSLGPE